LQTVIQGQISPTEGLREALEIVLTVKNVQDGVLSISSEGISGTVGIFCGRYITGALTETGESGNEALRKLLSVKSGKFSFLDTKGESHAELKQSLSVDLSSLLELSDDFARPIVPLLDDSITGYALQAAEQVFLADAAAQGDAAFHSEYDFAPQTQESVTTPPPEKSAKPLGESLENLAPFSQGLDEPQQTAESPIDASRFDQPIQSRTDASRFDQPIQSRPDASRFDQPIQSRTDSSFDQPVANPFNQQPQNISPPVPPLPAFAGSEPMSASVSNPFTQQSASPFGAAVDDSTPIPNPFNQPSNPFGESKDDVAPLPNPFGQSKDDVAPLPNPFGQPTPENPPAADPAKATPPVPSFNADLNEVIPNPFNEPPTKAPWSGQQFTTAEETDEGPQYTSPAGKPGPVAPPLPGERGTFQRQGQQASNNQSTDFPTGSSVDLNAATVSWQAQQEEGVPGRQENWQKEQQKWELAMQAEENPYINRPDWKPGESDEFAQSATDFSADIPIPPQELDWGEETWGELANKAIVPQEQTPPEDFSSMRRPERKPDTETPRELSTLIDSDERDRFFNDNGDVPAQRGSQTAHMARSSFQKSRQLGKKSNSTLIIILVVLFLLACAITVFFGPQLMKAISGGN
jgi:hypothetical protein